MSSCHYRSCSNWMSWTLQGGGVSVALHDGSFGFLVVLCYHRCISKKSKLKCIHIDCIHNKWDIFIIYTIFRPKYSKLILSRKIWLFSDSEQKDMAIIYIPLRQRNFKTPQPSCIRAVKLSN